jgi:thioesterase domain-containing protein
MTDNIFGSVADSYPHVVTFRADGAGLPLFLLPGSGGNIQVFQEIAAALPEGQAVCGIDMEWLCDSAREYTVESLAPFYLGVVRKVQTSGPYYFCGYSFGGLLAYEMAVRLTAEGERVGLVAVLDAPNPAMMAGLSASDSAQFQKTYLADRLRRYALQLVRGDFRAFLGRGFAFIFARLGRVFAPAIKTAFRMVKKPLPGIIRANDPGFLKAWQSFAPKPYSGKLVLFRVQDRGPEYDLDPSMGWNVCVKGGVEVHNVPGGHVDMMKMPSARVIAEKLAACLGAETNQVL